MISLTPTDVPSSMSLAAPSINGTINATTSLDQKLLTPPMCEPTLTTYRHPSRTYLLVSTKTAFTPLYTQNCDSPLIQ